MLPGDGVIDQREVSNVMPKKPEISDVERTRAADERVVRLP